MATHKSEISLRCSSKFTQIQNKEKKTASVIPIENHMIREHIAQFAMREVTKTCTKHIEVRIRCEARRKPCAYNSFNLHTQIHSHNTKT